jgi:P27 family predicted phage terminase small subunit
LLKPEDYAALLQHCQTWQTYITAIRQVRAEGVTALNPQTGCPRGNPALSAAETAGAQLLASCREFGLTPSSEQRLAAVPADDDGGDRSPDNRGRQAIAAYRAATTARLQQISRISFS